jgi:hypothetical protein
MRAGAVVPVGPGSLELGRLDDLVESLRVFVPDLDALVLVDDAPTPRGLERHVDWDDERLDVLRPPTAPRSEHAHDRMAAGTLTFLAWLAAEGRVDYLVKLDTDALVIGDFRPSLEDAIARRPEVGVWGAYRENRLGGERRDFSPFKLPIQLARLPVRPRRSLDGRGRLRAEQALAGPAGRARRFLVDALAAARRHGYDLGEHCLGGSYAVTLAAALRMGERGYLDDPLASYRTRLGEDVVLGILTRACGLELGSLVDPGEAFAVKFRGLLAEPEDLIGAGHAIVHSLKGHPRSDERQLRAAFARARVREEV